MRREELWIMTEMSLNLYRDQIVMKQLNVTKSLMSYTLGVDNDEKLQWKAAKCERVHRPSKLRQTRPLIDLKHRKSLINSLKRKWHEKQLLNF